MENLFWTCPYCGVNVFPNLFEANEQWDHCFNCGRDRYEPEGQDQPEPDADDNTWLEYKIDGGEPNPDYVPPKRKRK